MCTFCKTSAIKPREDLRKAKVARDHNKWLLGKQTQKDVATESKHSPRQFRRKTAWCWDAPSLATLVLTGEIHHAIIVDGIRVGSSVCLIARTTEFVIGWKWVPYESSRYWSQLIAILPPPAYVVCDGQKGMLHALNILWPETVIQRCRFHAWLNVKTKLTLHPESEAGKQLLTITRNPLQVHSKREARIWKYKLHHWFRKHHCYIEQRTNAQNPMKGHYTHYRVRSAYRQLYKITDDLLRSSYRPNLQLPRNINHLEGGINSPIRTLLKNHRGMSNEHQMKLVEQYLYSRTETAETKLIPGQKPPRKCL